MDRKPINSIRIKSAGWEDGILEVEFRNEKIVPFKVSESEYQEFITSPDIDDALLSFEKQEKFYIE